MSSSDASQDPRQRLRDLIVSLRARSISVDEFCKDFETIYNLRLDKASLDGAESRAFAALFDKVVWYSPFPEERRRIPNYLGETEIYEAALDAEKTILATSGQIGLT